MSVWFSAAAVVPPLRREWALSDGEVALLTAAVQGGFVAGALLSAVLNLPDRIEVRKLMAASAVMAGITNVGLLLSGGPGGAIALRFATGMFLGCVYPPGMKLATTHFPERRGLAIGVVVGALTVGSALPHAVGGGLSHSWRWVIVVTTLLAVVSARVIYSVPEGAGRAPSPPFQPLYAWRVIREHAFRVALLGYLGHMWELYAFWTWLPVFLATGSPVAGWGGLALGAIAFGSIGLFGAGGTVAAGLAADRWGRTGIAGGAMAVSAACCLISPLAFGGPAALFLGLLVCWGAAVVADSAQLSATAIELADPQYAGSALTIQTAIGFALTIASIRLVPIWASQIGWQWAFAPLAVGPVAGLLAMVRLHSLKHPAGTL